MYRIVEDVRAGARWNGILTCVTHPSLNWVTRTDLPAKHQLLLVVISRFGVGW